MSVTNYILALSQTGLGSLAAYLAAHVLLCLLPAFFIAVLTRNGHVEAICCFCADSALLAID